MAGREGGGGVMGQSHINSEEEQIATDGRTDKDGSTHTLNLFHVNYCFVLYHFFYLIFISISNYFCRIKFIFFFNIRLCFCIFV